MSNNKGEDKRQLFLNGLGERIRLYRETKQMRQRELAELVGLDQRAISLYEKGEVDIPITRLLLLARTLGVSITELVGVEVTHDSNAETYGRDVSSCGIPHNNKTLDCGSMSNDFTEGIRWLYYFYQQPSVQEALSRIEELEKNNSEWLMIAKIIVPPDTESLIKVNDNYL